MPSIIGTLTRAATRRNNEPLRVITASTHERLDSNICRTGHSFWAVQHPNVKTWNSTYAPCPDNFVLMNPAKGDLQIPPELDFDVILSQNRFGAYQLFAPISRRYQIIQVQLEHTQVPPMWGKARREACKQMRGHLNVFISEFSVENWGYSLDDSSVRVIHHGVDTDTFKPPVEDVERAPVLFSCVNDWINRDVFCGFRLWQEVTKGLVVKVLGATPGLSQPAKSIPDLVNAYQTSQVFLNTSLISPIPTVLLEAMSSGCAVISTINPMIQEAIQHGENGLLSNDPKELASYCRLLLKDKELCKKLGEAARRTILEKFSLSAFVSNWDRLLREAANMVYVGPP